MVSVFILILIVKFSAAQPFYLALRSIILENKFCGPLPVINKQKGKNVILHMQINTFLLITSQKYMYNMHISANSKTLLYKKEKLIFLLKNFFLYYIYMTVTA